MTMKYVVDRNGKYDLVDVKPLYGENYKAGYIGFCYDPNSIIAKMIVKATNYCNYSGINVNHALIVVDEYNCIEASLGANKVIKVPLSKYFDSKEVISFRKPRDLNDKIAQEIVALAESKIGCKYEYSQLLGHLGKALPGINQFNRWTHNFIVDILSLIIDNPNKFVCSELCAYTLKHAQDWEYRNKGILSRITSRINPQELFEDRTIFTDWTVEKVYDSNTKIDSQASFAGS